MQTIDLELRGVSPLMMNRMPQRLLEALRSGPSERRTHRAPDDEVEEAGEKFHTLPNGDPCIPKEMFLMCLISAFTHIKLTSRGHDPEAKSLGDVLRIEKDEARPLLDALRIEKGQAFPLLDPDTHEPATWEGSARQHKPPEPADFVCLIRPRFDKWMFRCRLTVDECKFPMVKFRNLIDFAGDHVGLGSLRPQIKNGTLGKFQVLSWEIVQEVNAAKAGCGW